MKFGNKKKKLHHNIMKLLASGLILSGGMAGFCGSAGAAAAVEGYSEEVNNKYYGIYKENDREASRGWVTVDAGNDTVDDVYSGYSQYGLATHNTVMMFDGQVNNNVYGGSGYHTGSATYNIVSMTGGIVGSSGIENGFVYGGYGDGNKSIVSYNRVLMTGGQVRNGVCGGHGGITVTNNFVNIIKDEGTEWSIITGDYGRLYGGYGVNVENNSVEITNAKVMGTKSGNVYGGYSTVGCANYNRVTMRGSKTGNVYGGFVLGDSGDARAEWNEVTIYSSTVYDVFGADSAATDCNARVKRNKVTINSGTVNNVYGGYGNVDSSTNKITDNTVIISGGQVNNNVYGGMTYKGEASFNIVTITGGQVNNNVYGGYGSYGSTDNNTVNIVGIGGICGRYKSSGTAPDITGTIYGGTIADGQAGTASGNSINIYGYGSKTSGIDGFDTLKFYIPAEAVADSTMLTVSNEVKVAGKTITLDKAPVCNLTLISGSVSDGAIYKIGDKTVTIGEPVESATVNNASVTVSQGTLTKNTAALKWTNDESFLAGIYKDKNGVSTSAPNNKVTLDSSTEIPAGINEIYGSYVKDGSEASGGAVDLLNGAAYTGRLIGGYSSGTVGTNTLNVRGLNNKAGSIEKFSTLNFYVPAEATAGSTMLTVDEADIDGSTIHAGVATGSKFKKADAINLLAAATFTGEAAGMKADLIGTGLVEIDGTVKKDGNNIVLVMNEDVNPKPAPGPDPDPKPKKLDEKSKSLAETRAGGMAILNTGADFVVSRGFMSAQAAAEAENNAVSEQTGNTAAAQSSFTPYAAVGGANMRYETGSYVDSKGWGANIGFARIINSKNSKLTLVPFVEYGKSGYDSYLNNGTHGSGDSSFTGVGFMAKNEQKDGLYYEGSVRFGRSKSDYQGDYSVGRSKYDTASNYLAFHAGIGKVQKLTEKSSLDYYGKFFYTNQNSDTVNVRSALLGDASYDFDAISSYRLRLGARWNQKINKCDIFYAGLAWDYEFDSEARAHYNGMSTPAPTMKGSSGMLELGWKQEANKENPFGLDLGLTGWCGKQKGISFNAGFSWMF